MTVPKVDSINISHRAVDSAALASETFTYSKKQNGQELLFFTRTTPWRRSNR